MIDTPTPPIVRWIYRCLLALAPPGVRRAYGPDMQATFTSLYAAAAARGVWAVAALLGREVAGMWRAHLAAAPAARGEPRPRRDLLRHVEGVWREVRYAVRSLRRDASWTAAAVAIVALGIGASATVFSVVDALLLRPLPFEAPDRLVWIANGESDNLSAQTVQVDNLLDLRQQSASMSDIAAFSPFYGVGDLRFTGRGEPERLTGVPVTWNFFRLLGVRPSVGRYFTADECRPNAPRTVMLAHDFWVRRLASDPRIVGQALMLDGTPATIVGVLPASFDFAAVFTPGSRADLFVPFPLAPETNRRGNTLALIGRLAPGADLERARAEARLIEARIEAGRTSQTLRRRNRFRPNLHLLHERVSGRFEVAVWTLAASVGFLMLLVCANLSNLLLARASARQQEMAVRAALGASRARLVRQMIVESVTLSCGSAAIGLVLTWAATKALASVDGARLPLEGVRVDAAALGFAVGAAVLTGLAFGVLPALQAAGATPHGALKDGGRGLAGPGRDWTRRTIVVAQIALVCVLLTGAGLLTRSLARVLDVELGFDSQNLIAMRVDPSQARGTVAERNAYLDEVRRQVRAAPGVEAVGLTDALPLGENYGWRTWTAAAGPASDEARGPEALVRMIDAGYLAAMRIRLRSGRGFTPADTPASEPVIIINTALAQALWPGQNPVGRFVHTSGVDRRVVGVVGGVSYFALERDSGPEMYMPIDQTGETALVDLVVRSAIPEPNLLAGVRAALKRVDPDMPVTEYRTMERLVSQSVFTRRFVVLLIAGFAGFGLILASLGIYAVISYSVTQRQQEIGIRLALGASPQALQRRFLTQTMRLVLAGLALGMPAAWAGARAIRGLLFGVEPADPATLIAVLVGLAATAALAGYLPARRASRIDPLQALRTE